MYSDFTEPKKIHIPVQSLWDLLSKMASQPHMSNWKKTMISQDQSTKQKDKEEKDNVNVNSMKFTLRISWGIFEKITTYELSIVRFY